MKKSHFGSWTNVPLDPFPPVDLSLASSVFSSSPPRGRQRFESLKRNRSASPGSEEISSDNKNHKPNPLQSDNSEAAAESQGITENNKDIQIASTDPVTSNELANHKPPVKDGMREPQSSPPAINPDIGTFGPSACLTPKSQSNKHFTFGSKLPAFKHTQIASAQENLN